MIAVEVSNRSGVAIDEEGASALARSVLEAEGVDEGELGLLFVGPDEMRTLKREHLGVDEPTDVLSFPIDGRERLAPGLPRQLGDVVICPELTGDVRAAVVHGALHLSGMDHEADEGEMLALQAEILRWVAE